MATKKIRNMQEAWNQSEAGRKAEIKPEKIEKSKKKPHTTTPIKMNYVDKEGEIRETQAFVLEHPIYPKLDMCVYESKHGYKVIDYRSGVSFPSDATKTSLGAIEAFDEWMLNRIKETGGKGLWLRKLYKHIEQYKTVNE